LNRELPFRATVGARPYDAIGVLPAVVLLHDVRSLYNVGAFFRTMDAVGGERLALSGITGRPPNPHISKTALGAEDVVRWESVDDARAYVGLLRGRGFEIAAVETGVPAVDLFEWRPAFPVCLVFGHEVEGIDQGLLALADTLVRLPMRGSKHSLNVATAGGVVLYELLRKYRELWRLPRGEGS
jgi:tRNA G18 (ribose-2'-O)-methylase SpoU